MVWKDLYRIITKSYVMSFRSFFEFSHEKVYVTIGFIIFSILLMLTLMLGLFDWLENVAPFVLWILAALYGPVLLIFMLTAQTFCIASDVCGPGPNLIFLIFLIPTFLLYSYLIGCILVFLYHKFKK